MGDIITQQCAIYKFKLDETKVNIYGEAAGEKYYMGPVLFNCLVERRDQEYPETDLGTDFNWGANFKFLRDDLVDSDVVPEVGDIILYQEGYYEVDSIIANQYYMGKNPDYPNSPNPLNPDLDKFGYNVSIICQTHYVPADKVGITRERLI
jgi:hypothetical protein